MYEYGIHTALDCTCIVHLAYKSITEVLITFFGDAAQNSLVQILKENVFYFVINKEGNK